MADSDDEWKFTVEDLPQETDEGEAGEEAVTVGNGETATADPGGEEGEEGDGVAGAFVLDEDLEPGQPTLENALFVALGVLVTVVVVLTMAGVI